MVAEDKWKCQTLFLSQIPQASLQRTMFPVGNMLKRDVKQLGMELGLEKLASKKEVSAEHFQSWFMYNMILYMYQSHVCVCRALACVLSAQENFRASLMK